MTILSILLYDTFSLSHTVYRDISTLYIYIYMVYDLWPIWPLEVTWGQKYLFRPVRNVHTDDLVYLTSDWPFFRTISMNRSCCQENSRIKILSPSNKMADFDLRSRSTEHWIDIFQLSRKGYMTLTKRLSNDIWRVKIGSANFGCTFNTDSRV